MTDTNWKLRAACSTTSPETDYWFPPVVLPGVRKETPTEKRERVALAVAACEQCPVRLRCADASTGEVHGIWAGIDKGTGKAVPKRKTRKSREANKTQAKLMTEASAIANDRRFNEFVETITTLHRSGLPYERILGRLGMSNRTMRQRLTRRDRLDLYSMLTGAAT